jgi:hypothetical protein
MNALLGFVFGYVVGAKAGPESIDELRRAWEAIRSSEEFQGLLAAGSAYLRQMIEQGGGSIFETLQKLGPLGAEQALAQLAGLAQSSGNGKSALSKLAETPEIQAVLARGMTFVDAMLAAQAASASGTRGTQDFGGM